MIMTEAELDQLETWQHTTRAKWGIIRLNADGTERRERITAGKTFRITVRERLYNHDNTNPQFDPFLTGVFRRVDESAPTVAAAPSPPAAPAPASAATAPVAPVDPAASVAPMMTDEQITALLGEHWTRFQKQVKGIDSQALLGVLLDRAKAADVGPKRLEILRDRIAELTDGPLPGPHAAAGAPTPAPGEGTAQVPGAQPSPDPVTQPAEMGKEFGEEDIYAFAQGKAPVGGGPATGGPAPGAVPPA